LSYPAQVVATVASTATGTGAISGAIASAIACRSQAAAVGGLHPRVEGDAGGDPQLDLGVTRRGGDRRRVSRLARWGRAGRGR
jgi:hypothetical protein